MPYIKGEDRARLGIEWQCGNVPTAKNPGELNFLFTVLIKHYIEHRGTSYQIYNDVIGALESCKLEFYRRKVMNYEEVKIKENGDAY
jgi:hypothetical protein